MQSVRTREPSVLVIGGGIAGLTAARTLREHGIPVRLFEAASRLAGLSQSFVDRDGFSYDFGAHFVTNRLAAGLGMGSACRTVRRYGETVLLEGRTYGYPSGLLRVPRFDLSALWARVRRREGRTSQPARTAAEWFRSNYGRALADEVALPLIEAWSGARATDLSAAVGDKIPGSLLRTIGLRAAARLTHRAVAIGYCRTLPESPHVWHVYPSGGVASMCERLAEGLGDAIQLDSAVERILVDDGRVTGVRVNGRTEPATAVISTAPVNILARMVEGSSALDPLRQFRYRPMIFVNMRFRGRGLLPDVVTWLPERDTLSFRLTEAPLSMPWLAPFGKTMITADIGCEVDDAVWTLSDDELVDRCVDDLRTLVPDARDRYLGGRVLRTKVAYPVFLASYEEDRRRLQHGTGIEGLISVGRNGEFDHLLMEDVYCRTLDRTRRLAHALLH